MKEMPPLAILVAAAENGVIGKDGKLPWHLPDELKLFKSLTMGHTVVMGRKTWDSIGKPLPGRRNVVLTRQKDFEAKGAVVLHDFEAIADLEKNDEPPVFVIGGAALAEEALPIAKDLHLTRVHASPEGDTFLPEIDFAEWKLVEEKKHERDERHRHAYTYQHWRRP
jgi:dihydrofolate reductase